MSNNSKLTPKLRFPEFRKGPGWEQKELGEIAEIKLGKMLDREKHTTGRLLPYLNNIALRWNEIDTSNLPQMYFEEDELDRFGLKAGDVVVCEGGEPGRSAVWDGRLPDLKFQKAIHRVRFTVDFNPRLFVLYLEAIAGTTCFEALFTGGGIKHLTRETFAKLELPFIPLAEQQKIADCFSSLDDLIAAEGRKLESLRTYKKGLMQQLFPRDGETTPQLRFPEFRDAGEWETKPLGRVVDIASGQVDPTEPPYCDLPHVGGENIESHTGTIRDVKTASELQLISGKYAFDENDVLYSKIRPALNKVAAPNFKGICSADIYPIRPSNRELRREYLVYLLLSEAFLQYATKHSDRSKIPKVNRDALLTYTVSIPAPAEQQRIADCLCSLDEQVAAQSRKIEGLKQHKKGLMQQLFPSSAEGD